MMTLFKGWIIFVCGIMIGMFIMKNFHPAIITTIYERTDMRGRVEREMWRNGELVERGEKYEERIQRSR